MAQFARAIKPRLIVANFVISEIADCNCSPTMANCRRPKDGDRLRNSAYRAVTVNS